MAALASVALRLRRAANGEIRRAGAEGPWVPGRVPAASSCVGIQGWLPKGCWGLWWVLGGCGHWVGEVRAGAGCWGCSKGCWVLGSPHGRPWCSVALPIAPRSLCGQDQTPPTQALLMWVPEARWHPPREKPRVGHVTSRVAFPTPVTLG